MTDTELEQEAREWANKLAVQKGGYRVGYTDIEQAYLAGAKAGEERGAREMAELIQKEYRDFDAVTLGRRVEEFMQLWREGRGKK